MSTKDEQKKQWKEDASQLKEDLDNRSKKVQKREVDLTFGGQKKQEKQSSTNIPKPGDHSTDEHMRKKIGL